MLRRRQVLCQRQPDCPLQPQLRGSFGSLPPSPARLDWARLAAFSPIQWVRCGVVWCGVLAAGRLSLHRVQLNAHAEPLPGGLLLRCRRHRGHCLPGRPLRRPGPPQLQQHLQRTLPARSEAARMGPLVASCLFVTIRSLFLLRGHEQGATARADRPRTCAPEPAQPVSAGVPPKPVQTEPPRLPLSSFAL